MIKDSGKRREFETGAVRDVQEGKGRMDLLPLDVISDIFRYDNYAVSSILSYINNFRFSSNPEYLEKAMSDFIALSYDHDAYTAVLELAKHYEEGAKKYAERNWEIGIPIHCYIDSGVRHLMKHCRGDNDEPHDRAFLWNMAGAVWTYRNHPELDDYTLKNKVEE